MKNKNYIIAIVIALLCMGAYFYSVQGEASLKSYTVEISSEQKYLHYNMGGREAILTVTLKNNSPVVLDSQENFFVSYHLYDAEGNQLFWDNDRSVIEKLNPKNEQTNDMLLYVPEMAGEYIIDIDIVHEGQTWFSEQGNSTLKLPLYVEESYAPDYDQVLIICETNDEEITAGDWLNVVVTITNEGTAPIYAGGKCASRLSYHVKNSVGEEVLFDGVRYNLLKDLEPGESAELEVSLTDALLREPGEYTYEFDMVIEGVTWFSENAADGFGSELKVRINELYANRIIDIKHPVISSIESSHTELDRTWRIIQQVAENTSRSFGVLADNTIEHQEYLYPQFWVRDNNTSVYATKYFNDRKYLYSWIELHLVCQGEDGNIQDWIAVDGTYDKNTVETDQEASLVQAACNYVAWSGELAWLDKEINGKTILERLDMALDYVWNHKRDSLTGLIVGAHTVDWGDVEIGEADHNAVYLGENSIMTVDIYDQAMFALAAKGLMRVYGERENDGRQQEWRQKYEAKKRKLMSFYGWRIKAIIGCANMWMS